MPDRIYVPYVAGRKVSVTLTHVYTAQMWNFTAAAWQAFASGSAAQFALALTDASGIGQYSGVFPAIGAPADVFLAPYDVAGAAWATTDIPIGGAQVAYDGFDLVTPLTGQVYLEGQVTDANPRPDSFLGNTSLSSVDQFYSSPNGRMKLCFVEGALRGLNRQVVDYIGATRKLTVKAFPVAPANGDCFYLIAGN
jgi:hypothetical protein